jgi:hypothetical protein
LALVPSEKCIHEQAARCPKNLKTVSKPQESLRIGGNCHMTEHLPESQRKEIFDALVDAQDHEMSVLHSRVAKRFSVTKARIGGWLVVAIGLGLCLERARCLAQEPKEGAILRNGHEITSRFHVGSGWAV